MQDGKGREGRRASSAEESGETGAVGLLSSFPEALPKLSSPEAVTSADASDGDCALSYDDACNMMWLDSEGIEDDGLDSAPPALQVRKFRE
jgi:hypothetical protein